MEDATSIFQLRDSYDSERKAPLDVVSYSDVLKNLQSEEIQQQTQNNEIPRIQSQTPPLPQQPPLQPPTTSNAPVMLPQNQSPFVVPSFQESNKGKEVTTIDTFQNEMIILLLVYVFVHMSHVQSWLRTKVPNIVDPSGSTSILGLLMNGIAVIVIWNISKKMIVRYMNEL